MKKRLNYILAVLLLMGSIAACKKEDAKPQLSSSLIIVNAIPGAGVLVPNFYADKKLQYYKSAQQIAANGFSEFGWYVGDYSLAVSQLTDTTHTVINCKLHLEADTYQTLFVTGTLAAPDTVYTHDNIKPVTDSVVSVRFVNISKGSSPVTVNLQGNQAAPIVTSLAYKAATAFMPLTAKKGTPASNNYVFEIRDAATAKVLVTYTLTPLLPTSASTLTNPGKIFKNVTIAFKGVPGGTGTNAQGVILVNNF